MDFPVERVRFVPGGEHSPKGELFPKSDRATLKIGEPQEFRFTLEYMARRPGLKLRRCFELNESQFGAPLNTACSSLHEELAEPLVPDPLEPGRLYTKTDVFTKPIPADLGEVQVFY